MNQSLSTFTPSRLAVLLSISSLSIVAIFKNIRSTQPISNISVSLSASPPPSNQKDTMKTPLTSIQYTLLEDSNDNDSWGRKMRFAAVEPSDGEKPITIQRWAELFSTDDTGSLAEDLTNVIKKAPYNAFFFETKGTSSTNASMKQFEFVLVDAPSLASFCESNPDPGAFAEHFPACSGKNTCTFNNLGGDALLVTPVPPSSSDKNRIYSHLAPFLREAQQEKVLDLWKQVAKDYLSELSIKDGRTVWLSTSGLGIAWLHFRMDTRPKYYQFKPFARET